MIQQAVRVAAVAQESLLDFVNRELLPLLRQLRDSANSFSDPVTETATADVTVAVATDLVLIDATTAPVSVTLARASQRKRPVRVVKTDASANAVAIATVNGTASLAAQWDSVTYWSDGAEYYS